VSVVVTVRDADEHLPGCLAALAALDYPDYEVVVVDDGSTDGTRAVAASHPLADRGDLRVVSVGSAADPLGIGASRNRGVAAATGDVVAFTDADCRPAPTWLADLVPYLAGADVVGGRIRPHGDTSISAYEGLHSSLDMGPRASEVRPDGSTPYLPTANLVARRAVLADVGFPPQNVGEDVDFCWRAHEAGYDVAYVPTGTVAHAYRTSVRAFSARRADYGRSEALLSGSSSGASGGADASGASVPLPVHTGLLLALLVGAAPGLGVLPLPVTAVVAVLLAASGLAWARTYRRIAPAVTLRTYLQHLVRSGLSALHATARAVSRYYSLPLAAVALLAAVGGLSAVAGTLAAVLALAVALPVLVGYLVHRPALSPLRYALLSILDDLAYQWGVYRGARRYRTLGHLDPTARFGVALPFLPSARR
jgi:mycofactocin system glycosyltransferase